MFDLWATLKVLHTDNDDDNTTGVAGLTISRFLVFKKKQKKKTDELFLNHL